MEQIVVVPVIGNLEVATLQIALEYYFTSQQGTAKHRNAARALYRRLMRNLRASQKSG